MSKEFHVEFVSPQDPDITAAKKQYAVADLCRALTPILVEDAPHSIIFEWSKRKDQFGDRYRLTATVDSKEAPSIA